MNERIKSLVYEAEKYALNKANEHDGDEDYENTFEDDFQEKFAELIVGECASKVDNILREKKHGGGTMGDEIREHFGVEE